MALTTQIKPFGKTRIAAIELKDLAIGYPSDKRSRPVAESLSATVYSGELTCLLGANGAGKSTLLKTLSAFLPPLSGEVLIDGKPTGSYRKSLFSRLVSVVLTDRLEVQDMSVTELVALGRTPYTGFWGRLSTDDEEIIRRSLAQVGATALADRQVLTLSDGERQKVMIAKALAQETPVILLDEPTAFLDFRSKVEIMQLLHRLSHDSGKTIFLSTHDIELALQVADRLWLMDREKGIRTGIPEDLSLDGTLALFFERRGIVFDPASGLFRIENDCSRSIGIKGEGPLFLMVRKALQRSGIFASEPPPSGSFIEIKEPDIFVHGEGDPERFGTIEALLKAVDSLL